MIDWRLVVNLAFLLLLLLAALRYRLARANDDEIRQRGVARQLTLGGAGLCVWLLQLPWFGLSRYGRALELIGAVLILASLWWLVPSRART